MTFPLARYLVSIALLATVGAGHVLSDELPPKKVGLIVPLTGDVSPFGKDISAVAAFANETLASNKFELLIEDDRCIGKNAMTAASKLLHVNHADFGMIGCTEPMLTVAPLFESRRTIVITPLATGASVSSAGDYIFRTWPSDALAGRLLFDYVKTRHKKFGLLSENRGYPQELAGSFVDAAAGSDLKLVKEDYLSGGDTFRTILLRLRASGIDGLLVNPDGSGSLHSILKRLREMQWAMPIYGVYMPGHKDFLDVAGSTADGIIFVDGPSDATFTKDGRRLLEEFGKKYGNLHSTSFIFGSTFEAFRLMVALSQHQGDSREFLYTGKFKGVFGSYSFDRNGDIVGPQHVLKIIRNGKAVPLADAATG